MAVVVLFSALAFATNVAALAAISGAGTLLKLFLNDLTCASFPGPAKVFTKGKAVINSAAKMMFEFIFFIIVKPHSQLTGVTSTKCKYEGQLVFADFSNLFQVGRNRSPPSREKQSALGNNFQPKLAGEIGDVKVCVL